MNSEQIPIHQIINELVLEKDLWCDKRLFSLINRALNLAAHKAHVKKINEVAVSFDVIPFGPPQNLHG